MIAVRDWAFLDGYLAERMTPPLSTWTARRALNFVYSKVMEGKNEEEREEFDRTLNMTMSDWIIQELERQQAEQERRRSLVLTTGEVA